jgi:glycogen phosphorylase
MNIIGRITILPKIPAAIERLHEIAYNVWWSWDTDAQEMYRRLDPVLWEKLNHNPVRLLHAVAQERLNEAASSASYLELYHHVVATFDRYMAPDASTWLRRHHPDRAKQVIAYFSAEFGLHEALPIYSGGLGILSGDHCKAASDLGLPFVGVGFLYPQGYFTQRIDDQGRQQAEYEKIDFAEVPATQARDLHGNEVLITVDLPGRTVYAKVWCIQVGRIPVYLMDTDVERNAPQDRELSARLYGGDREMRISQEVVLGIGGVRALRALGYEPAVWHMNEGHSAFLGLERVREMVQEHGLNFDEAVEVVRSNSLFTTHTPVPAGNDAFAFELIDKFFWQYWGQLGLDRARFISFASQELPWGPQYSMTVLALRLSGYHNGVSKLHGEVSRDMWHFLWPELHKAEVPIGHITNGVHTQTWLVPELKRLYSTYLGEDWIEHVEDPDLWKGVDTMQDQELWHVHHQRKEKLVEFVRQRVTTQLLRHGEGPQRISRMSRLLDPRALTIGFARRFATYKRAVLLFRDIDRIKRIVNDPERPVQIIFSGKAHPDDEPGKALIQQVYELSQTPDFESKIIFVENYDMNIARHLISGVDLWLNTPRRPREASGTSGQKAALSGVPNFSILDGWWVEGYDGTNGWAIGEEREYKDLETQDAADADSLYTTLEEEIIPLFFDRNSQGVPVGWVEVMKNAIRTCGPAFSMRRMVIDYTTTYYLPAAKTGTVYAADSFAIAKRVAGWKHEMSNRWPGVRIEAVPVRERLGLIQQPLPIQARVWLQGVPQDQVAVELVVSNGDSGDVPAEIVPLEPAGDEYGALLYHTEYIPTNSGKYSLAVRVRPKHSDLVSPHELGFIQWA